MSRLPATLRWRPCDPPRRWNEEHSPPAALEPTSPLIQVNGVEWLVDTTDPDSIVWTAVDRPVYVQVTVSADTDSAPVTALGPVITETLPAQPVDAGG